MANKYLPGWRDRKAPTVPATELLRRDYEAAHNARLDNDPSLA